MADQVALPKIGVMPNDADFTIPDDSMAIEAITLSKSYGAVKALDSISFKLPREAFLTVFGPNGAGKSTLLRLLSTLIRPSGGNAKVLGLDLREDADRLRGRIGLISHRSMLYPDLTAFENLMFYAQLYGLADPEKQVSRLLDLVELTARRHDAVRGFSRGMTQRVAIARALVNDPELLLLDEPYSGLDPRAQAILDELIVRIRPGRSFLMISHDLDHGLSLATHVMVLNQGRQSLYLDSHSINRNDFAGVYREAIGMTLR